MTVYNSAPGTDPCLHSQTRTKAASWGHCLLPSFSSFIGAELLDKALAAQEEKHIEGLKNYRGLNKFKRACLNMCFVRIGNVF